MSIPEGCKFTAEHEWIKQNGEVGVIGISEYAQRELGDVVFVELPEVGREIKKGETFCNVESVKAVSDVYAPVDGTITEVNERLRDAPELLNSSSYEDGWIIKILVRDTSQLAELKSAADYEAYTAELSK